jgi:hypothetical protein
MLATAAILLAFAFAIVPLFLFLYARTNYETLSIVGSDEDDFAAYPTPRTARLFDRLSFRMKAWVIAALNHSVLRHTVDWYLLIKHLTKERDYMSIGPERIPDSTLILDSAIERIRLFRGRMRIAKRVYADQSFPISIILYGHNAYPEQLIAALVAVDKPAGKELVLQLRSEVSQQQELQVAILAAGANIEGDQVQKQNVRSDKLIYQWSCSFPKAEQQIVTLQFTEITACNHNHVGNVEHKVNVVRLDHMNARQLVIWGAVSALASLMLTAIKVAHTVGWWPFTTNGGGAP